MVIKIVSFKRGRKTQNLRQAVLKIEKVSTKEEAKKYIGKKVEVSFSKNSIRGVVTKTHGDNGRVVVRFRRGLPGQALTKEVKSL
ncbi:50S ribosomal protein L35ae [Candidatus Parvarchaeota archaeon]|jgi:Ribosomal protein L35AE/L33A|nr:50S ribosomal protein L35ae [Candidatus Parvarchaeota archaeon]